MQLTTCNPCSDAAGHELCFISHPKHERRISCDVFGTLRMPESWRGWEVWRFDKLYEGSGKFVISSWVHDDKVLCSDEVGGVFTASKKKLSEDGRLALGEWRVSSHPKSEGVRIQSVKNGRFLAFNNQDLYMIVDEGYVAQDTAWHLDPGHRNQFFIASKCHNKMLSSTKDAKLATRCKQTRWETWIVEPTGDVMGEFTIRSLEHGRYLGSSSGGEELVSSEIKHNWTIASSPHGVFVRSVEHGVWLSCDDDGNPLLARVNNALWETWRLEPIMPVAISGKKIWSLVSIGATATATAVAMPFAVMGAVGYLGFGAGGIAAGSIGAGMMSAEAIAAGGGVAVGGTVATLQSIGAAGLGVAGTSAAAGTGAVVGGSLGVFTANKGLENEHAGIRIEEPETHLPLCAWRMWK